MGIIYLRTIEEKGLRWNGRGPCVYELICTVYKSGSEDENWKNKGDFKRMYSLMLEVKKKNECLIEPMAMVEWRTDWGNAIQKWKWVYAGWNDCTTY